MTSTEGPPRLTLHEIEPPRRRLSAALLIGVVGLAVGVVCFVAGARWGAETESRRWWREWKELRRDASPPAQGRGDLWLRCPSSTTWRNYAEQQQEWHVVTANGSVMTDGRTPR